MKKVLSKVVASLILAATIIGTTSISSSAVTNVTKPDKFRYIGTYCDGIVGVIPSSTRIGDANLNGHINQADANYMLRYITRIDMATYEERHRTGLEFEGRYVAPVSIFGNFGYTPEMDINQDKKVNQADATLLLQYLLWRDVNGYFDIAA